MCLVSTPKQKKPPEPPRRADEGVRRARADERRRRAAGGIQSTILTSPLGATGTASTTSNTLLGA